MCQLVSIKDEESDAIDIHVDYIKVTELVRSMSGEDENKTSSDIGFYWVPEVKNVNHQQDVTLCWQVSINQLYLDNNEKLLEQQLNHQYIETIERNKQTPN